MGSLRVPFDRQPSLSGDLLDLRPLRANDWEALFAVASDPLIWEQHPDSDRYQEEVFRRFFDEALGSGGALVALDRADGRIIGSSRYHGYDPEKSVVEIGWTFLARKYWGGRYNGEMKRLMLEHAFRSVDRVLFIIGPTNRRSQRAVEKIGAVLSGGTLDPRGQERVVYELTPALYARTSDFPAYKPPPGAP
jgi:N-acetyltransferase